jgi:hypothetical protein
MDIAEARKFVSQERTRWLPGAVGLSDEELLLRRERLHNALSVVFAFTLLIGYFVFPTLGSQLGDLIAIYGTWAALAGCFFAAVQQGTVASQCRNVREFLKGELQAPSA